MSRRVKFYAIERSHLVADARTFQRLRLIAGRMRKRGCVDLAREVEALVSDSVRLDADVFTRPVVER